MPAISADPVIGSTGESGIFKNANCATCSPAGAAPPREVLPSMAAVGDHAALKKLVTTTGLRVSAAARAAAPARLDAPAEAAALEADADALYAACCCA